MVITPCIVFVTKIAPTLTACPNPVALGEVLGTTTISWDTDDESVGKLYVSKNGGEESLVATGHRGSVAASWIGTGSTYEFRLYTSDHAKLLAKVVVTRAAL